MTLTPYPRDSDSETAYLIEHPPQDPNEREEAAITLAAYFLGRGVNILIVGAVLECWAHHAGHPFDPVGEWVWAGNERLRRRGRRQPLRGVQTT